MSSPKRAAKLASKTPTKAARQPVARAAAALPKLKAVNGASGEAERVAAVLEGALADGKLDIVDAPALQKLIAAACRLYTARAEAGEKFTPVTRNSVTATDVMVTASGLLRAADLAVFELGMWQSWTGR